MVTPAKMPFEVITDTLGSIQKECAATGGPSDDTGGGPGDSPGRHSTGPQEDGPCHLGAGRGDAALYGRGALVDPTRRDLNTAFLGVDTVLNDTWKSLPKALQDKLDAAYRAGGVRPPGDRPR